MKKLAFLISLFVLANSANSVQAFSLGKKDVREQEAEYVHKVLKEEEKEKYEKKKFDYKPSGYMTVYEYEALSQYKEKPEDKIEIPKQPISSDMNYVPQPTYKIVRYNDPPGSPELNIKKDFYKYRQYNGQGITAPDYSIMAYPVVYYYPNSASTASDIFVIKLEEAGSPLNKIMKANVVNRLPEPIISTEKSIDNDSAFHSLTPIDFSADSSKLLVKEKIGSSQDGIWKTNAIVYDFETKTSYNLVEVRDAICYYWKEVKNLDLEDKRWDIFPMGFLKDEPERIAVYAYAYTGEKPVFLGIWTVDVHGQQSRLLTFNLSEVELSVNGFKIVQDGVVKPVISKTEQKALKKSDKIDVKNAKKKEKTAVKEMKTEYKAKIKQMDEEFKEERKNFRMQEKIKGTTSENDIPKLYVEKKIEQLNKEIEKEQKVIDKAQKDLQKLNNKSANPKP